MKKKPFFVGSIVRSALLGAVASLSLCASPGCGGEVASGPIEVGITGEDEVRQGLTFNAMPQPDELVFVDGWTLRFDRWLTVVGGVRLNQPGRDPAQQQIVGDAVAAKSGPWVASLTRGDFIPITQIDRPDAGGGFDTKVRYAFSFDLVPATAGVMKLNLDASDEAALQEMIRRGYSTYAEVTATHPPYAVGDDPVFALYPTTVKFTLAWGGSVSYINCANPDNGTDEGANRGVQPRQDASRRAGIHMHIEHPFWDTLNTENPPLRFDAIAARARLQMVGGEMVGTVGMDDLEGSMVSRLLDLAGKPVPDRCAVQGCQRKTGALFYDPMGATRVETLKSFLIYSSQAMAHLNGEGLCYVERK